jgi:hypothetical protein
VWLDVQNLGLLDIALSSNIARKQWLIILSSNTCKAIDGWHHSHLSMRWVIKRNICVTQLLVNLKYRDTISDLTFQAVGINGSQTVRDEEVKGESNLSIWKESKYLLSIDLTRCRGITDMALSALGHGCGQLQTMNISACFGVTDIGL